MNQIIVSAARASTPIVKELAKEGAKAGIQVVAAYGVIFAAMGTAFAAHKGYKAAAKGIRKGFTAMRGALADKLDPDTDGANKVSKAA